MVYISSTSLMSSMRQTVMSAQSDLATASSELSSGTYADLGLSIGGQSGQVMSVAQQQNRLSGYTAGNTAASTRLSATDSALTSLQSTASSFLASLTTAASTGSLTSTLQDTAAGALSSLTATLNTTVDGQAIFGGVNTATAPMTTYTTSPASANAQAVNTAFSTAFGTTQTSTGASSITASQMSSFLSGSFADLFSSSSYASTWSTASDQTQTTQISSSQTISTSVSANNAAFRGLAEAYTMVSQLTGSNVSADTQAAVVKQAISVMTTALSGLTDTQANVGLSENAISDANTRITAQSSLLSTENDSLTSVDVYALNTKITSLQTQIEAAYKLTTQLQSLSLVNYLS